VLAISTAYVVPAARAIRSLPAKVSFNILITPPVLAREKVNVLEGSRLADCA
jgi:hypothetical protein